jgi:hypothetical protein
MLSTDDSESDIGHMHPWLTLRGGMAISQVRFPALPDILKLAGLEQGPLSLVSTTEALLERESSGPGLKSENMAVGIHRADHVAPSIHKSWH